MDNTLFPSGSKNEQISADLELSLITQAQARFSLLTAAQPLTFEDKKIIRQGERALERLLASQIKYIESRVQRLCAKIPGLNRTDLLQSAQEGVIQAIHNFDLTKGVRLITWAWHQISTQFKALITGEVRQSKAEYNARKENPVALNQSEIDIIQLEAAQGVIVRLKAPVQKIIALRIHGHEFPAIGKLVGKTADACRMSYNRAIQRIRQQLLSQEATQSLPNSANWMSKLKLRYRKNVRFGNRTRHNAPRVSRPIMSKRTDKALLAVSGLISLSILGFSAASVGRVPQCQTQTYNIGLPIFTFLLLSFPYTAGYAARGVMSKRVNPSPRRLKPSSLK